MITQLRLPTANRSLEPFVPSEHIALRPPVNPPRARIAYAAAHVVCDPWASADPQSNAQVDWEATMAYRRHLWSLGFSIAEAMDTAQRGMGLAPRTARELITRSLAEARATGGGIACGTGTDQLDPRRSHSLADIAAAYREQCEFVEGEGGRIILMASRALAATAANTQEYERVYASVLEHVKNPVILHWLGDVFDPLLAGYWGTRDLDAATETCLRIITRHAAKIDGIKISLLEKNREIALRRRLPPNVRMYTGDDFNYPELILGDEQGYSHALLGIFDAIALPAACALEALDAGDIERYNAIFAPTLPLSRHIFAAPTYAYKTGVVFLAYLNGHQNHFRMIGGLEGARSIVHLAELFRLADAAGVITDLDRAMDRMRRVLATAGIE
ncbi:MAG TPA: dihydrodipicolinate synthase family protein [Candidatus Acidoferrales bacterium]|nr:dihydrodipicolinate synthase family protein [Candidatus Acidoferrales bacterium]